MGRNTAAVLAILMAVILAFLPGASTFASSIYKCSAGGKVSYGEHPCAHGKATALAVPPPSGDTAAARAQLERDKARLAEIEQGRSALEVAEQRDRARAARAASALRQKCERLRLKQKWAMDDLARAGREATAAARLKAKRQAEALAVECPA